MNTKQTELTDEMLAAIAQAGETLARFMTIAQRSLSPDVAAATRHGLDAGELDVHLVIVAGAAGMRVTGAFTDQVGEAVTFCNVFLPPDHDENESSNEAGTPQSLH
jgi:hypothetical protein